MGLRIKMLFLLLVLVLPQIAHAGADQILASEVFREGINSYQLSQYKRALSKFELAMFISPDFTPAKSRKESLQKELDELIQMKYIRGLQNFQALNYGEAIEEWRSIVPIIDKNSEEVALRIKDNIELAQYKLKEGKP